MERHDWDGLFDFSNPSIQMWEVEQIRAAERDGTLLVSDHAFRQARSRNIDPTDMRATIRSGRAVEKDMPSHDLRDPGISFRMTMRHSERAIKAKVSYRGVRYIVVTTHYDK